jgi:F0F1-type ATP synthase assembly protein I
MISSKWIFLGLIVSLAIGLMLSEFISGVIVGALLTLIADSFTASKKRAKDQEVTNP